MFILQLDTNRATIPWISSQALFSQKESCFFETKILLEFKTQIRLRSDSLEKSLWVRIIVCANDCARHSLSIINNERRPCEIG